MMKVLISVNLVWEKNIFFVVVRGIKQIIKEKPSRDIVDIVFTTEP